MIAQCQQPAPDVALDRPQRDAGAFGDLLVREPVDVRQPDHLARSCGERIEGVGDRHPVGHTVDLGFGVRAGGRRRRFLGDVGPAVGVTALTSHVIDDPTLGDADQPRSQRAAGRVELITPTPGADEHVLGDLAGAVVAERLATDRVDERTVGVIDRPQIGVAAGERCAEGIGVDHPTVSRAHADGIGRIWRRSAGLRLGARSCVCVVGEPREGWWVPGPGPGTHRSPSLRPPVGAAPSR